MKMNLLKKMVFAFLLVSLFAGIPSVVALNRLRVLDDSYVKVLHETGFVQGDLGKAMWNFALVDSYAHDIVSFENEEDIKYAMDIRDEQLIEFKENMKTIEKVITEDLKADFENVTKEVDEYLKVAEDVIIFGTEEVDSTDVNAYTKIEKRLVEDLDPAFEKAHTALTMLMDNMVKKGDVSVIELEETNSSTYLFVLIFALVAVGVSIIFGVLSANNISNPIKKCIKRLEKLSEGDLKTEVPEIKSGDETQELAESIGDLLHKLGGIIEDEDYVLGRMADGDFLARTRNDDAYVGDFNGILLSIRNIRSKLVESLTEIDDAAEQVGVGSEQVASGAQELAQGATEQASAVEELTVTIDGIANEVKANAKQAKDMSKLALTTEQEIEEGNRQMNEMTIAMSEISNTSNKIAKIIKTIDDIAFQTNILALNAAVEAARAGSAGKGFAVVADEVRNLAGKSAEAAKNTTELIESSIKAVENGTQIADKTAATLNNVVETAQKTATIVNQMATSSEEQAKSIEEVTKGIEQISAVVQTNSATSEQSAAASEELSCQAGKMRDLISKFNIGKKSNSVAKMSYSKPKTSYKPSSLAEVSEISLDDFDMNSQSKY
ncbi:MAG: methyl-accepting chemotaxis protein [Lachnospiraceae bacterium]|nr:methyl-accepting chemotaxis protein [Lachnospiraceae bacterium]